MAVTVIKEQSSTLNYFQEFSTIFCQSLHKVELLASCDKKGQLISLHIGNRLWCCALAILLDASEEVTKPEL